MRETGRVHVKLEEESGCLLRGLVGNQNEVHSMFYCSLCDEILLVG